METIFISIAAYNDPQLVDTIKSALDNALSPENIYFGIALQYYKEPDLSMFDNVKTISYNPDTRPGIVRVRHNISKLYSGQTYYLQIDSHYSFAPGWDKELIDWFKKISKDQNTKKIMILPLEPYVDGVMASKFKLHLEHSQDGESLVCHPHPVNSKLPDYEEYHEIPFARVGQIFFPGEWIDDVGFDQFSHTIQEIFYFSYRTIMSGYKVFQLNKKIMWQSDAEYYKVAWHGKDPEETYSDPNRFKSAAVSDNKMTWYEMSLALVYNKFSKYAIEDAVMTPEDFWIMQGDHEGYSAAKEYFDSFIFNQ